MKYTCYKQLDAMDCGPTCLKMVCHFYKRDANIIQIRKDCDIQKQGVSMAGITNAAEKLGLGTLPVKLSLAQLADKEVPLPCILHWNQSHFVTLFAIKGGGKKFVIGDPGVGKVLTIDKATFTRCWLDDRQEGIALLLEPTPDFYRTDEEALLEESDTKNSKLTWAYLGKFVLQYKRFFFQIVLGLLAASLFQLMLPFLTQNIVDKGVNMQNLNFVYVVLTAQMVLLVARFIVEFSRQGLLLYISTHVNLSLLTEFWKKLMRLPVSYFDTKQTGDILQRIGDQNRIESFLTGNSISTLFSLINFIVYSVVLFIYSPSVFLIFLAGSVLYFGWVTVFLKQRRKLNYQRFAVASRENSATMQMIYGMQEIKMHNSEQHFRWGWERLQRSLFRLGFKSLSLSQMQQAGGLFINEGKNLVITAVVAATVIKGELTLGTMLAIQYILGALNSPVQQFIGLMQDFQDAKISLERLNEIHMEKDEPEKGLSFRGKTDSAYGICIDNLSFGYSSMDADKVLKDIHIDMVPQQVTAIVGMSGSGKTTILKILQKFYDERYEGSIKVYRPGQDSGKGMELKQIIPREWRDEIGCVMQDGFIFNATIGENISVGDEERDTERLVQAATIANIMDFINELPLGFDTRIGNEGVGVSMGQRQRILIARAVYKDPKILFFDEATNSLDANNEKVILENLNAFFRGRTVVVVAHRLSTVKNADKIVVLHNGVIQEEGTHQSLTARHGAYYELVKNQLELGN